MKNGAGTYVALFNISDEDRTITLSLPEYELNHYQTIKELWSQQKVGGADALKPTVKAHGAVVYRMEDWYIYSDDFCL